MTLLNKALFIAGITMFASTIHAYNDPQTDYDSLYGLETESVDVNERSIDIAVFETDSASQSEYENTVDPQTDYDSLYE